MTSSTPRPEVIDGGDWHIRRSPTPRIAHITAGEEHGGTMTVPLDPDDTARAIRAHEMTHVRITPRGEPFADACEKYGDGIVNLVEDDRVHRHMRANGFEPNDLGKIITDEECRQIVETATPLELAATAISLRNVRSAANRLDAAMIGHHDDTLSRQAQSIAHTARQLADAILGTSERPDWDATLALADALHQAWPPDGSDQGQDATSPADRSSAMKKAARAARTLGRAMEQDGRDSPGWARMRQMTPPLPVRMPSSLKGRRRQRPADSGRRLGRSLGRLHSDGRVFLDRPPTKGGGAVLVDVSGSMKLEPGELLALMTAYPAGVIACYSSGPANEDHGILTVIAKDGRRCTDAQLEQLHGGCNVCDGPALRWLAAQRGPRYWISDALVNGVGGQCHPDLLTEALDICRQGSIRRVNDAHEIVRRAREATR